MIYFRYLAVFLSARGEKNKPWPTNRMMIGLSYKRMTSSVLGRKYVGE